MSDGEAHIVLHELVEDVLKHGHWLNNKLSVRVMNRTSSGLHDR